MSLEAITAKINIFNNSRRNCANQKSTHPKLISVRQASHSNSPLRATSSKTSKQLFVREINQTVKELEQILLENHRKDFTLRMALQNQTEKVNNLHLSLRNEQKRNHRLVQLMRGVDSSSTEEEVENINVLQAYNSSSSYVRLGTCGQSRSSLDAFESISPLLMQQRYEELSASHKQCRRQLLKKSKFVTLMKYEKEEVQASYENLLVEYRKIQKRLELLCCKYLRLQARKNQEIQKLREALSYASDCVLCAEKEIDTEQFRQNFQLFVNALRLCEWVQSSCSSTSCK